MDYYGKCLCTTLFSLLLSIFPSRQEAETMFSVTELVGLGHVRKRLIQNVRDRKKIREEEELEKRNVKTLIDREYAEMERQKIREKK